MNFVNTFAVKNNNCFFIRSGLLATIVLVSGCASAPEAKHIVDYSPTVSYALSLQGAPYRYGKSSPEEGFDCSGFVKHVYERQGIRLPRTVQGMAQSLAQVPKDDLHSGDLVFFNTDGRPFSHVGIYINNDNFI
ncbi:MAG: C40 family peptidase, partial [Methylobacter sp.]